MSGAFFCGHRSSPEGTPEMASVRDKASAKRRLCSGTGQYCILGRRPLCCVIIYAIGSVRWRPQATSPANQLAS